MSFRVLNRKTTRRGVRTWFRCDGCGQYGDMSTPTAEVADDLLAAFNRGHDSCLSHPTEEVAS